MWSSGVCAECRSQPSTTVHALLSREHIAQDKLVSTHKICASCSSTPLHDKVLCDSVDCPVMYTRTAAQRDVDDLSDVQALVKELEEAPERTMGVKQRFKGALDW